MKTRYQYSAINHRPDFEWQRGKRLAIYIALNLEAYRFGEGLIEELVPAGPQPDVINHSWCEYGNRVAVWRLLDLFKELGLPVAALLNSDLYAHAPAIPAAFRARGDEIVAHGRTNSERQNGLDEDAERALIEEATRAISAGGIERPGGWLGPWLSETAVTVDLLKEAGYAYVLDYCMDAQPIRLETRSGPLLSVPYPQEINDSNAIAVRRMHVADFADMIVDELQESLRLAHDGPSIVMGVALHANIAGQPFRLKHLRRALAEVAAVGGDALITTPGRIAALYESACPG